MWSFWICEQLHSGLFGSTAAFSRIATDARRNGVFPCRVATLASGDDMINASIDAGENCDRNIGNGGCHEQKGFVD